MNGENPKAVNHMKRKSGYAEVNETRLYYEIAGEGDTVILIHGFSLDVRQWNDQFEFLANQYRVLRYDLRGFGKSMTPTGIPYTHTDDLKALLDYLNIQQAHVLGHSFGGRVAISFAILYPEMTLSLIGADPALEGYDPNNHSSKMLFEELNKIWSAGKDAGVEAARELWLQFSPFDASMKIPTVARRIKKMIEDYSGWHWVNDDTYQPISPPAAEQLDKIHSPTLILVGSLNPKLILDACNFMSEKIANAKKVQIPGVSHMLNMEDPNQFNIEVLRFLQSL